MNLFDLFEQDSFTPPTIEKGEIVLIGRFKNKKAKVTGFTKDDNNQPVLKTTKGDTKLFKPRFPKLMEGAMVSNVEFQFFVKEIMEETGAFIEAQVDRNELIINYVESGGERGSGYRSLKMLLDFADKNSMKTLLAVLHGAPRLIEYYTKLGFSVDGVTKRGFAKWFSEYKKTWNIDDAEEVTMFRLPKTKITESTSHSESITKVLDLLQNGSKFKQFRDRIKIFGSVAMGKENPGDVDIMLDYTDTYSFDRIMGSLNIFLALAQKFYGSVDVFVKCQNGLYVRNENANGWVPAKFAKKIWNDSQTQGKTLDQLGETSLKEATFKAYHGSNSKIEGDFDEKLIGTGIDSSPFVGGVGMLGKGFYFTPSERKAADYGEHVVEAELTINNPLMIGKGAKFDSIHDAVNSIAGREVYRREFQDILRKAGYDGIVKRDYYYPELDEIVVFDPKQIVITQKLSEAEFDFKTWFGDSKVVDRRGQPLVVYHGSENRFDAFDESLPFHYFSPHEEGAASYGGHVGAYYLSIKNPLDLTDLNLAKRVFKEIFEMDIPDKHSIVIEMQQEGTKEEIKEWATSHGYDGVLQPDSYNSSSSYPTTVSWVAFYPDQIKSATDKIEESTPLRYHGTQASHDLNSRLRYDNELKDDDHATIKELDAMIAPLDQDMVLWRGVKSGFATVKVGSVISDAGYVSTSTSVDQAKVFALGDGAAMLRISVKKGTPVIDLRAWEGENEIVIPRGSRYKVDEIIERPGRVPTILLTVV